MSKPERVMMLISIIGRGKSKSYIEMLNKKNIRYHLQSIGHGTAPSEMMDIFGLQSNDKDIIISFAPFGEVAAFAADLGKNLDANSRYGGLLVVLGLSAVNRLAAEILSRRQQPNTIEKGAELEMKNEHKHQLILITVNQGYTDRVMQTAKKAGATGGTVIRARLAGAERLDQFGIDLQEEREIVMILAPVNSSSEILEEVNRECGLKTPAGGVVCAVPVEKAFKI